MRICASLPSHERSIATSSTSRPPVRLSRSRILGHRSPPQQACYPEAARRDVQPFIPVGATSALDVGCGPGGFGQTLRQELGPAARIVGVEPTTAATTARQDHGYDEVLEGYFPEVLQDRPETYDLICFNDVLEHMVDPWVMLRQSTQWLAPGGHVLALIPSIQFAPVVWRLMRGHWDYTDTGTLDRTHVRFFTRKTMIELSLDAGIAVDLCVGVNPIDEIWRSDGLWPRRMLKTILLQAIGDSRFCHFVVRGHIVGRSQRANSPVVAGRKSSQSW